MQSFMPGVPSQAVKYHRANKAELYTLSTEGVNQYRHNIHTEFTALDQWQREVSLFTSLKKLKTFLQYKLWKNFRQVTGCINVRQRHHCLTCRVEIDADSAMHGLPPTLTPHTLPGSPCQLLVHFAFLSMPYCYSMLRSKSAKTIKGFNRPDCSRCWPQTDTVAL